MVSSRNIESNKRGIVGNYGKTAVRAVELLNDFTGLTPTTAWIVAAEEILPHSRTARGKSCPRGAFVGLCQAGYVQGIVVNKVADAAADTKPLKNQRYAVKAAQILCDNPAISQNQLWDKATEGLNPEQNGQMDVVITLYNQGLLCVG